MNKLYLCTPLFFLLGIGNWTRIAPGSLYAPAAWGASLRVQSGVPTSVFGCLDTLYISLGSDCNFDLTPEIALNGSHSLCTPNAAIRIIVSDSDPLNGSLIDGPGLFRYTALLAPGASCSTFQSCQGIVVAEDKAPPVLTAPADVRLDSFCAPLEYFYNRPASLSITGKAVAKDNCTASTDTITQFRDEILFDNRCDTVLIERTFRAVDRVGNVAEATQQILLVRPRLSDFRIAATVFLEAGCNQGALPGAGTNGPIAAGVAGLPYIVNDARDTVFLSPGGICGFSASYRDDRFSVCANTYKIIRRWTLLDWCRQQERILEQHILIGDVTPPVVACPVKLDTLKVSVSPFDCRAAVEIPAPLVKEACGTFSWAAEIWVDGFRWTVPAPGVSVQVPDTSLVGVSPFGASSRIVTGVPAGCHRLVYKVRDECGNASTLTCRICVSDLISPVALSQNKLNVALGGSGYAYLSPADIDRGSRDNCGLAKLEIRRKYDADTLNCAPVPAFYSEWGNQVTFSCCDLSRNVLVELRATDLSGNSNISWAMIWIEDKIAPVCTPPKDTAISCLDLPPGFSPTDSLYLANIFGGPLVKDNCGATFVALPAVVNIEQCGSGTIKRRFQALDKAGNRSGNVCEQTITLRKAHRYAIKFPKDFAYQCGGAKPETALTFGSGCDLLAVRVTEKKYGAVGNTCQQIYRTFEVINWCEYNGTQTAVEVPRDADCNGASGDRDVWVIVRPDGSSYLDADQDEQNNFPEAGAMGSACSGRPNNPAGHWTNNTLDPAIQSRGIWKYTQVISIYDAIPPKILMEREVTICSEDNCSANVLLSVGLDEHCSEDAFVSLKLKEVMREDSFSSENGWERFGRYPKYLFSGKLPAGHYLIEVLARDGCGNSSVMEVRLNVVDCTKPEVVCLEGLSMQLMPLGPATDADGDKVPDRAAATVWASDFIKRTAEKCSLPLRYSINRAGDSVDINKTGLVLTCRDRGLLPVEIHVWDDAHNPFSPQTGGKNRTTCLSHILVQDDPGDACGAFASDKYGVNGRLSAENGAPLGGAEIYLNGGGTRVVTNEKGIFRFEGLKQGGDYSIVPKKEDVASNGVTTHDLVLVAQHILGVRPLRSPYSLIAADVNMSGSVTTMDVVLIRRLILNFDERLPHGKSWRFVDAHTRFEDPGNPWRTNFPEIRNINNIRANVQDADFIAIKIGDVNHSSPAFQITPVSGRNSPNSSASLTVPELDLVPGMEAEIPVRLGAAFPAEGCQFALYIDPDKVRVEDLRYGQARAEHINMDGTPQGWLLLSWDNRQPVPDKGQDVLLLLKVRARSAGRLSEALRLDHRMLAPEAYISTPWGQLEKTEMRLRFVQPATTKPTLHPIVPNPAAAQAKIRWTLPAATETRILVRDAWNRSCMEFRQVLPAGEHVLELQRSQLPAPGIYFVTMEAGPHIFSQKIIFLE
ncbi:MAG: hypothetical protein ACOYOO_05045 [Saprospiraceae bacterium]